MEKVKILGTKIDNLSLTQASARIRSLVEQGEPALVVTANPEIMMLARQDQVLRVCLDRAKLVTADGIGVVLAARLLGAPVRERVTGIDLATALFRSAKERPLRFFLVGAAPGVAELAAQNITKQYPGVQIAGVFHGYFQDDREVLAAIVQTKPDIVLAGMGMGKQEKWLNERVLPAGIPVGIGVGGSFDVFSGKAKRAPRWLQRAGLEWLYRLVKEPWRYRRMLQLPRFLWAVVRERKQIEFSRD